MFIMALSLSGLGQENQSVVAVIKAGDLLSLRSYLEQDMDPNSMVDDRSLLQWAIRYRQERMARLLIEYGAEVNELDKKHNTPLIYAAELNNGEFCKLLIDRGADPLHKNLKGRRASDYAYYYGTSPAYKYLVTMEKISEKRDTISSLRDGPYIYRENSDQVVMTYFEHDQDKKLTRLIEKTIWTAHGDTLVKGFGWDKKSYYIKCRYEPDPCNLETSGNIFIVGDIHGKYWQMLSLLINNKIIDEGLHWTFGKGQLIILGDVFDRGGSVTETLWFLHRIQGQARESGGNVHLLLGNHEMMALTRDYRYLHDKYDYFTSYFQLEYSQLFEKNTVIGSWLRSLNVILRVNDYLFSHAGISPELAAYDYSFEEINDTVRAYLFSDYSILKGSAAGRILGEYGPQWYRGYTNINTNVNINYSDDGNENGPLISQEFVDDYLNSRGLKKMVIGHNEQLTINTSFNGKIISADVAIDDSGKSSQGLLIIGDEFYRCLSDGTREPLFTDY